MNTERPSYRFHIPWLKSSYAPGKPGFALAQAVNQQQRYVKGFWKHLYSDWLTSPAILSSQKAELPPAFKYAL